MDILFGIEILLLAALFSLALTPADFYIAKKLKAIDTPRDARRMHSRPIPRLGGVSILFCFLLFSLLWDFSDVNALFFGWAGAILVGFVGVLDDRYTLSPALKLFAQSTAACVSMLGGNVIERLSLGEFSAELGILSFPLTLAWILTLVNAHNFIDGLDGLCAGVSLAESLALALIVFSLCDKETAVAALVLGGACLGFLPYNAGGAKIFMGDTGSTTVGFLLAFLSTKALFQANAPTNVAVPLLLFALPLADITFAVTRRLLSGKNPFVPDRSHIHHLLADRLGHHAASKRLVFAAAVLAAIAYFVN